MASVNRRKFLIGMAAFPAAMLISRSAYATHYQAMLCGNCGFGSKKDNCAKCGKWMGGSRRSSQS